MSKLTKAQSDFLDELAYDNPQPTEPWKRRDNWDPMFPLAVIDACVRKGLIETHGDRTTARFEYRFTPAGRAALSARQPQDGAK